MVSCSTKRQKNVRLYCQGERNSMYIEHTLYDIYMTREYNIYYNNFPKY